MLLLMASLCIMYYLRWFYDIAKWVVDKCRKRDKKIFLDINIDISYDTTYIYMVQEVCLSERHCKCMGSKIIQWALHNLVI